MCNTSLLLCLPSDQLNSPFPTSLTLEWISRLSPLCRFIASSHLVLKLWFEKKSPFPGAEQNRQNKNNAGCKESHEEVFWDSSQVLFSSFYLNDSPVCDSVQMSSVHTWAGGRPALCLWPMDQHLRGPNPPALSLYLRGRGFWRLPASPSWTALTLTSVWVCMFGMNV